MVGLVLVSHSRALAEAVKRLVTSMTGEELVIATAGGSGENHDELGTDAMEILAAIQQADTGEGVVVLMDMGSAVLSAETALDFLEDAQRARVRLCSAPFVEGAVAAGVTAKLGSSAGQIVQEATGALQQKREHLHENAEPAAGSLSAPAAGEGAKSLRVTLPNAQGIHARPAARLAQEAARFQANVQVRNLTNGKGPASTRSVTGLVMLEARKNHEIEIVAAGAQADQALAGLKSFVEAGLGDGLGEVPPELREMPSAVGRSDGHAIGISKGLAWGRLFFPGEQSVQIPEKKTDNPAGELQRLRGALERTRVSLKKEAETVARQLGKNKAEIFLAQALVAEDPELIKNAEHFINEELDDAARAWWRAVSTIVDDYFQLSDELLRARAADLRDVGLAVLKELGVGGLDKIELPEPGLVVVRDFTPGQVTQLDPERVRGVLLLEGGRNSHSAILLRARGIPAVAQAGQLRPPLEPSSTPALAVINGETGDVQLNPDKATLARVEAEQTEHRARAEREKRESHKPAVTRDGRHIEVVANVGSVEDARLAAEFGADGVGLLRTEFLFLDRTAPPSEDEQFETLREIARALPGKPIIVRTLDAGGDKELSYLNMPKEDNPFLGVRAIRLCLQKRELFQTQLRAIFRAALEGDLRVMFPLVSIPEELAEAKTELARAHEALLAEKIEHRWPISVGMMMEVPSAALRAREFATEVDFFSIGTNDLTQYTVAVDRGNPSLHALGNPLNPAVLHLIGEITAAARERGIPVAVCGEAAADPSCAAAFLKLGVNELSMNPRTIPGMKQWVREQE